MIHYHGPEGIKDTIMVDAMRAKHFMVSFAYPSKLPLVAEIAQSFVLDNGAFSLWRSGKETDWQGYYAFVEQWYRHPGFDWALIPDVIGGNEIQNKALLDEWPFPKHIGVPVWHMHESLDYLAHLAWTYPRVAFGSSGQYAKIGTMNWEIRMAEAMQAITDSDGRPVCKIHGLRMLNPEVFKRFPFASADSTNVARNHTFNNRWSGSYQPLNTSTRAHIIAHRVEYYNSSPDWQALPKQQKMWSIK